LAWLLTQFLKIAFLTGKPYEIPGDQATLRLAVLLSFITHIVALWGIYPRAMVFGQVILDLALTATALFIGLSIVGKSERFIQAFSALCGANMVINLASIPVIYSRLNAPDPSAEGTPAFDLIGFFFLVWSISIFAHIIRFSFDTNIPVSIVASLGYIMLAFTIYDLVFPM